MRNKRMPLLGAALIILITTLACLAILPTGDKTVDKPNIQTETIEVEEVVEQVEEKEEPKKESEFIGPEQPKKEIVQKPKPTPTPVITPDPVQQPVETPQAAQINTKNLGQFKTTAYCNCTTCCGKWSGGPTASGVMPAAGRTIAVDPRVIPLGTKVMIDGNVYIAEDTGGSIKGNRIDIYFSSHSAALNWGVRYKNVEVIV